MWDVAIKAAEYTDNELRENYAKLLQNSEPAKGSLSLNGDLDLPKYLVHTDIHRMPGGYGEDDIRCGAVYTAGADVFFRGGLRNNVARRQKTT